MPPGFHVCPTGKWSPPGATGKAQCALQVPAGSYSDGTTAGACPIGHWSEAGATSTHQCHKCGVHECGAHEYQVGACQGLCRPCPAHTVGANTAPQYSGVCANGELIVPRKRTRADECGRCLTLGH